MIAVGQASGQRLVLPRPFAHRAAIVNFRISLDRLSAIELMHSSFASAGRYCAEMLRRLQRHAPAGGGWLIVNPRFAPSSATVGRIVAAALDCPDDADFGIVADRRLRVAGLLVRRSVAEDDIPVLAALSADDAYLDQRFLDVLFGWRGEILVRDLELGREDANGFVLYDAHSQRLPAILAIQAMAAAAAGQADRAIARRRLRRVAVMPYQAGDVLFLCEAIQALPVVDAVLVFPAFAPIVRDALPDVEIIEAEGRVPRSGDDGVGSELSFIAGLLDAARQRARSAGRPLDGLFYLLRQQRDYSKGAFHLRRAYYFAIGGDTEEFSEPFPVERAQRRHLKTTRSRREQVVLHFDGGWPLKGYPPPFRQELIHRLRGVGYSPVVLGPADPRLDGCAFVPFTDLASFSALLSRSAALIGVDSFPANYALHYGLPTLHLFASTPAREHPRTAISESLHLGMRCVPCGEITACRLDRGSFCHNTAAPADVVAALMRVAGRPSDAADLGEVGNADEELALGADIARRIPFPGPATPLTVEARDQLLRQVIARFTLERVPRCTLCRSSAQQVVGEKAGLSVVACESCGLWFFGHRIPEQDLGRFYDLGYWNSFVAVHGYPTAAQRYAFDYVHALERVAYLKRFVAAGRSLDVGCGYGALVRRLKEHGFVATGLDTPPIVSAARRYSGIRGVSDLPEGERWDLITMFDVVEHLYEPARDLGRLVSRLNPGGAFVLETFRRDCAAFEREGFAHEDVKPLEHPYMYRERDLRELLRQVGLEAADVLYPDGIECARIRIAARARD